MPGTICLQGGAEFGDLCRPMDLDLLARADGGPVVVVPLAAAVGREAELAGRHGVEHFAGLGAVSAVVAPDARSDPGAAEAAFAIARLLVLPGGSPGRLLDALRHTGADRWLDGVLERGGVVMGASAGAMVLGAVTLRPGARPGFGPGLGLLPGLAVVPHASDDVDRLQTVRAMVGTAVVVGIPECAGIRIDPDGSWTGMGASASTAVDAAGPRRLEVGATWALP
ncbi:MAG TPA: Type 1 glutamine amidotransferase-like domain-containing protein [Mycobacteriales bacterium]|nr:Type 1 glutamine amidotransferase-like domain-containing protein [Mycobacteriales bacterium]